MSRSVGAIRDVSDAPLDRVSGASGRVAVVTGGARGIGFACCARLAEAGATVLVADIDEAGGRARRRCSIGPAASRSGASTSRTAASVRALGRAGARASFGRLDIWVNTAGIYPTSPLLELSDEDWDAVLDVNLRGTFIGAREAARAMIAAGRRRRDRQRRVDRRLPRRRARRSPTTSPRSSACAGSRRASPSSSAPHGIRVLAVAPTVTLTPGLEAQRAPLEAAGFALEELGPTAAARPRRRTRRRRPRRGLLRERPLAADDRAARCSSTPASSPAERFEPLSGAARSPRDRRRGWGPSKPSMSSVVTSGSSPSRRQTSGTARQYCSSAPKS